MFNAYRRIKHDKTVYFIDLFKKKKYKKFLHSRIINYTGTYFYYYINPNLKCVYKKSLIDNISISYKTIVDSPLNELLAKIKDKKFAGFIKNYLNAIKEAVLENNSNNSNYITETIDGFFIRPAKDLRDALQRILLINQLLWQTGHRLNCLGRLDVTLFNVYKKSNVDVQEATMMIRYFLETLHQEYSYKSNFTRGDTGQIVVLGGTDENGSYYYNDLTNIFIDVVRELRIPDPKTLLRVSEKTPKELLAKALESIATGCGSPLLSNDKVVIPSLEDIGYTHEDALNYATSACWEPLCDGKSLEQNNIGNINFVKPFNDLLAIDKQFDTFDELLKAYFVYLRKEMETIINSTNATEFAYDPLMSLFVLECNEKGVDISNGGARYNNYGILSTGLGNLVDSLLNVKKMVFDNRLYSLQELVTKKDDNFSDETIHAILKSNETRFGVDDKESIDLTNAIIDYVNDYFGTLKNRFGGVFRFGLSSPNYIVSSSNTKASLDGRRDYEPFNVHISANGLPFTEVVNFSSKLHYGGRNVNGNVCDLMTSPNFIDNNIDKMVEFLEFSISQGFFQMQFNVVDSKTLLMAKENPEKFKDLIVRVWGFSAYFVELPEEYQNLLIERAKQNENAYR